MSAKEYYDSVPDQRIQSPESFWKGGDAAPPKRTQSPSTLRKSSRDNNYISPHDPAFPLTNFPSSYATVGVTSPPSKPIPVPPPKRQSTTTSLTLHHHVQSPPAPQSPQSQVTDESDESLVHINPPPREPLPPPPPLSLTPPPAPASATRRSDSLSLTQTNLHHHNVLSSGSGISTPLRGDYTGLSSTRKRLRVKELATHGKDTLIQMLVKQECSNDESRKLLRNALDKLEQYKLDMLEANNHCRRLERACQKLTDERMLMHTQVTEAVSKAQQQVLAAQQELSISKLKLEHTEQALTTAQADLREARLQRDTAKADAEHTRNEAHRIREESNIQLAREQGRKQGFDQGVQHGRVVGVNQGGGGSPRQITQAGEPGTATATAETSLVVDEANTSGTSTNRVPRSSSSRAADRSSTEDLQRVRMEFDEALERARKETEDRLQRDLEARLDQERHRLEILSLQQQQQRERDYLEERERLKKSFEQTEKARAAEIRAQVQALEERIKEERLSDKDKLRRLQQDKERERVLREREQEERMREREDREREKEAERERLERERQRLERERERVREMDIQRDRERDLAVAKAVRQAAEATANANAVAASATRPSSEASGSDHEYSGGIPRSHIRPAQNPIPPLPYIPMPRPPMEMPTPNIPSSTTSSQQQPQSSIIPATFPMPEPITNSLVNTRPHSRSATQPNPPTVVSARQSRSRRYSVDSQSSISTAGALDSLLSFPYAAAGSGKPLSTGSGRGVVLPGGGVATSTGSNGRSPGSGVVPRNAGYSRPGSGNGNGASAGAGAGVSGPYGNPTSHTRDVGLDDIPEDDSIRASPAPIIPPLPILNMPGPTTTTTSAATAGSGRSRREQRQQQAQQQQQQQQQPPSWYPSVSGGNDSSVGGGGGRSGGPVIPTIRVEGGEGPGWRDGEDYDDQQPINAAFLDPRPGGGLHRSDSANSNRPSIRSTSSYEFNIEPPSNPTSPREHRTPEPPVEQQPHNQFLLSPLHAAAAPLPAPQPPVPTRGPPPGGNSSSSGRQRTQTSSSGASRRSGRRRDEDDDEDTPTEPSSPVIPTTDARGLPPGFVPQAFTPRANPPPSLSPVNSNAGGDLASGLPPGFVPQAITDSFTGVTTPLSGLTDLPSVGSQIGGGGSGNGGGGSTSRRQSIYGNPNATAEDSNDLAHGRSSADWGAGTGSAWGGGGGSGTKSAGGGSSPYTSFSTLPTGPPVIPGGFGGSEDIGGGGSGWATPSQRARSIYGGGTPAAGSSRSLPGNGNGTPAGGGVYQNPLRQEEGDDDGDLVARNTKINATAPPPQALKKKKKKTGK